jgi:hypothetical protein
MKSKIGAAKDVAQDASQDYFVKRSMRDFPCKSFFNSPFQPIDSPRAKVSLE